MNRLSTTSKASAASRSVPGSPRGWRFWRRGGAGAPPRRHPVRSFVRIRGLGLVYVAICLTVGIAATNTGNNSLFLVMALMLGVLVFSGWASRWNVQGLAFDLDPPSELFAQRPAGMRFSARNRSRWLPRWLLLVEAVPADSRQGPSLLPFLPRNGRGQGRLELLPRGRGLLRLEGVRVESAFPFGLFAKAKLYRQPLELLVYPEIFDAPLHDPEAAGRFGDDAGTRRGQGYGLYQLRAFQDGDDPRRIHWKRSARGQGVIVQDMEEDRARRVSILLDNGLTAAATRRMVDDEQLRDRFERLVSEAATAALDYLDQGFDVELVTRRHRLPYAAGRSHRYALLEHLALLVPEPAGHALRPGDPRAPRVRLALETPMAEMPALEAME